MPKISVVIPTLNRASVLEKTIEGIESQTIARDLYEVIVVDNASTDDTQNVLAQKSRQYSNLRVLCQPKPGAAPTRNAGLRLALGDIILFIDNDILAERDLIERHLESHARYSNASIIGNVVTPWQHRTEPFLRYLYHRGIYNPYTITAGPMDFSRYHTGNVSTPRSMLLDSGGFNEEFFIYGMEDIELGYRLQKLGCRMVYGEQARATHQYFPTYKEFIERCEQAGYSLGKLIELHPELKERFIENGKWTRLLKHFHQLYRIFSLGAESVSRCLARREEQRGSGPISKLLELHYFWSVRYHFFLGYSQYRHHVRNGSAPHVVLQIGRSRIADFP
jgi:glycosyltransferase involved in cell wall biosynthesis